MASTAAGVSSRDDVQVVIRVRPFLERESSGDSPASRVVKVTKNQVTLSSELLHDEANNSHTFTFDRIYDIDSTQAQVFETTAKPLVDSCLQGYNATILAYGQTGTGKTYTMEGCQGSGMFERRGVIPRAIEQIFTHIQQSASTSRRFLVRASYLQIYKNNISDLLKPGKTNLAIRQDKNKGVYVEDLSEWVVRSPQEVYKLMYAGGGVRATASTKLNEVSSRSHAVLKIIVEQCEATFRHYEDERTLSPGEFHAMINDATFKAKMLNPEDYVQQHFKVAKLNLVDLAGSERVRVSGATGSRLEETKKINKSLSALGNVISALTETSNRNHIPYRDSKLTRILEDSLGGNCKTTMMAMISPAEDSASETLSTLKFANRAKNLKNFAHVNEDLDKNSLLRRYEKELQRLRQELKMKNRNVVDKRRLLELEEEKRRAEADKMAAICALESRSLEFMREKLAKRKLEERIQELTSQMLTGGENVQDTPQFRKAVTEHRNKIRAEYRDKLTELERERQSIEEQKAQVDRYKVLLIKQRDIMVALTQRLNERDDQIVHLQGEIDSYEARFKELEEKLDKKTTSLIHLQKIAMEHNAKSPVKNSELDTALAFSAESPVSDSKGMETNEVFLSKLRSAVKSEIQSRLRYDDVSEEKSKEEEVLRSGSNESFERRVRLLTEKYQSFRGEMDVELERKDKQIKDLREENSNLKGHSSEDTELLNRVEAMRRRSIHHSKEQAAVRTIMQKIQSLVDEITLSSSDTLGVQSQFAALASLVNASVEALNS